MVDARRCQGPMSTVSINSDNNVPKPETNLKRAGSLEAKRSITLLKSQDPALGRRMHGASDRDRESNHACPTELGQLHTFPRFTINGYPFAFSLHT